VELRAYWAVIRRRLWIIVALVVIAAAFAGYQYYKLSKTPGALKAYQSNVTVRIGLQADPNDKNANATDYLTTGETLADEIVTGPTLTSKDFVARVKQQLDQDYTHNGNPQGANQIDEGAIAGALTSTHAHSILTITTTYQTPEGAKAIATAVGEVFTQQGSSFLDYEIRNGSSASDTSIHPQVEAQLVSGASDPGLVSGPAGNKPLQLAALVLVSLLLGIALAFLMEYLDDRVRNKEELEDLLQLPIIGEIPAASTTEKGQSKPRQASVS
jgi:capsular polysaccharide biosynthesis protein